MTDVDEQFVEHGALPLPRPQAGAPQLFAAGWHEDLLIVTRRSAGEQRYAQPAPVPWLAEVYALSQGKVALAGRH